MKQSPAFLFMSFSLFLLLTILFYNKAFDTQVYIPLAIISAGFCGYSLSKFELNLRRKQRSA